MRRHGRTCCDDWERLRKPRYVATGDGPNNPEPVRPARVKTSLPCVGVTFGTVKALPASSPLSLTGGRVFCVLGRAQISCSETPNTAYLWRYLWREKTNPSNIRALYHRKSAAHNGLVAGSSPAGPTTFQSLSAYCLPVLFHPRSRFAVCICGKLWQLDFKHAVNGRNRYPHSVNHCFWVCASVHCH